MELALLRTLISRDFYEENKGIAKEKIFRSKETKAIKNVIDFAMLKYKNSINVSDVEAIFFTSNSTLTTTQKEIYASLFRKIEGATPLNKEVAQDVLCELNREDAANELVDIAFKMSNGEITTLNKVSEFIDNREEDFIPLLKFEFEDLDIDELLRKNQLTSKWKINIPTLAEFVPGVSDGQLIVGAARPNTGKTSSHAYLCAGPNGFLHQGATVLVLANEEDTGRVGGRYLTSSCDMSLENIHKDKTKANELFVPVRSRLKLVDATGWDLNRMERAVKFFKPDILVADMADKFQPEGTYTAQHDKLKDIYIRLRIISKQHNCTIFAMSQLSAEAEGKVFVDMSMLEGSRTGKASEADVLFCITKTPMIQNFEGQQEQDSPERHWLILKNKLTGRHGKIVTLFDSKTGTFRA